MQALGDLPGGVFFSAARDISADGSLIVGRGGSAQGEEAYVWEKSSGMRGLGYMPGGTRSFAQAISADGAVVVGQGDSLSRTFEAFRWTQSGGLEGLGALEDGRPNSDAQDVSADGSVVVGYSFMATGSGNKAFRWTRQDGMEALPGEYNSEAVAVSADGDVVAGTVYAPTEHQGVLWLRDGSIIELGFLTGRFPVTTPQATTADGSILVGTAEAGFGFFHEDRAFIWDSQNGIRDLNDLLTTEFGMDLAGWELTGATDISPDGTVIVGYGTNPAGAGEAWIAVIPEPTSIGLLALGLLLGLRRNRYNPRRFTP